MLVAGILIVSSLIIATLGPRSKLTSESGIFGVTMIDVVATTLIADPSTVVASGFTALYLVAAASMLLQSRQLSTLVAALTVMDILPHALFHMSRGETDSGELLYAGLRGVLVFVVSWLGQIASATLVQAEQRAEVATTQARRLKLFNHQIVEHMQTGILIAAPTNGLRPVNSAARDLLLLDNGEMVSHKHGRVKLVNNLQLLLMVFELPEGWHSHGPQNGDDGNHYKAFDEGKSYMFRLLQHHATLSSANGY